MLYKEEGPGPLSPETKAIHTRHVLDPARALTPPLYQTSTFTFPDMDTVDRVLGGEEKGFAYSRSGNPTVEQFESVITELEGGEASRAFASGMGAVSALLIHLAKGGERAIVVPKYLYIGSRAFIQKFLLPWKVPVRWFDPRDPHWEESLSGLLSSGAGAVFVETPSNPTMDILDLSVLAKICRTAGVPLAVDNTFATPVLQRPIESGSTFVVHSATKYLGGHGDLLGGILTGPKEVVSRLALEEGSFLGATLSPFNAWLILRGIKTLHLRMKAHCERAGAIASFLAGHPKVLSVRYPGLPGHPGHDTARRQMRGFGGMLSFELASSEEARRFADRLSIFQIGVSLGDPESLIEHPWSMSHRLLSESDRRSIGLSPGFLRMSVGLEGPDDLIRDLERALSD